MKLIYPKKTNTIDINTLTFKEKTPALSEHAACLSRTEVEKIYRTPLLHKKTYQGYKNGIYHFVEVGKVKSIYEFNNIILFAN